MIGLISGYLLACSRPTPLTTAPVVQKVTKRASVRTAGPRPLLGEGLFRDVLIRERKRSDRSNESFLLLLVSLARDADRDPALTWKAAAEALAAARRETDVVGWLERGRTLGVIVPEIAAPEAGIPGNIEGRVRRELAARLDPETLGRLSIRFHMYPSPAWAAQEGVAPVDPLLHESQRSASATVRGAVKRGLDVVGSLALLIVLAPLFAVIAALVKLTAPGPALFRQERVGRMARPFTMLKFRTMRVDADPAVHQQYVAQFIRSSGQLQDPGGNGNGNGNQVFKLVDDPRVTPLGHFLRRSSLDELPQLWNVLRGEMSLVGPRPPLFYELEQYQPWHRRRVLEAKPGVTGLWQVTGRSRTTFDQMVRLDLRYARACSLWTDIRILLATPAAVFSRKGAC